MADSTDPAGSTRPVPAAGEGVTVRFFAAAKAAAGTADEQRALPSPADLRNLLGELISDHGSPLGTVLDRCSFLVNEVTAGPATPLAHGAVVDILPPFAGG